jgi:hypothetical protein
MAAEYSRDLAHKCRGGQHQVVSRGFQMGPLPPLGYRRCSVSADGQRRAMLDPRQRKIAATDRIQWVLASQEEVELVKRICDMYARTRLSFTDIAQLGRVEGWRDHEGRPLSGRSMATLVRNEALIGNFVWGRTKRADSMSSRGPSRSDGCLPRIVDSDLWDQMRRRDALEVSKVQSDEKIVANLRKAFERTPLLTTRDLRAQGLPSKVTIRKRIGSWSEFLRQAGRDPDALRKDLRERMLQRKENGHAFGAAFAGKLSERGHLVSFDRRLNVFNFPGLRMRLRLLWPTVGEVGQVWRIRVERISRDVDFDLLVRMEELFRPKDFFVVPPADVVARFPHWLAEPIPAELHQFWHRSPQQLLDRIQTVCERVE